MKIVIDSVLNHGYNYNYVRKDTAMSYRVNHLDKKTGVTYVYESSSFWDKELKQSRNRQVCIGKLDPDSGELIPSKRLSQERAQSLPTTAQATIVGPSIILDALSERLGLRKLLKAACPTHYAEILSMAYYLACEGGPLSHSEYWMKSHSHPAKKPLTSQRISEILGKISTNEKQAFLSSWMKSILENDYLCYDITSISSYSELNEYIRFGYNRDHEPLPQLNLAMLFGEKSGLPAYYERIPGNISDVQSLHNLLETFKKLEVKSLHYVLDKGFYSKKNIDELLERRDQFTISVPLHSNWIQHAIDEVGEDIHGPEGYRVVGDEVLYVHSQLYPWGEQHRRCYLHLYYNDLLRSEAVDRFNRLLIALKKELESGTTTLEHEELYESYFIQHTTAVRGLKVSYNMDAVHMYIKKYAGFQAILSTSFKDPIEALWVYRNKDIVEKCFDDLKNSIDMKRLRMHTRETIDGRLFVQFIALILTSALRSKMRTSSLIEKYTVRELLLEMEPLTQIRYTGKYGSIITEVTKPQREILSLLGIAIPSST